MPMLALKPNMPTAKEALRNAVLTLQSARIESASLDARLLLEHALGLSREQLLFRLDEPLSAEEQADYDSLIARRAARQPVAQLTGKREFWGREFMVSEDTLDPRPDSETLIQAVLERLADRSAPLNILDLGTGTGCLLLTLLAELPGARGTGVDLSQSALDVAQENALRLGLQARTTFRASRWCDKVEERFDVIVANPPYIPSRTIETLSPEVARFEPKLALDGGEDGLDAYRDILPAIASLLLPGGFAVLEIGEGQIQAVEDIAADCGLRTAGMKEDLGGVVRCVIIER